MAGLFTIKSGADLLREAITLGNDGKYAEALKTYKKAFEKGEPEAAENIGRYYERGRGVAQDLGEALYWYETGADAGDIECMKKTADFYYRGIATERDLDTANYWARQVPEGRRDANVMSIIWDYDKRENHAEALRLAGKANTAAEHYQLGRRFYDIKDKLYDPELGYQQLKIASDSNHALAMYFLSETLLDPKETHRDPKEAYRLKEKLAETGNVPCMQQLYRHYRVSTDQAGLEKAFRWLDAAYRNGVKEYSYDLGQCYRQGIGCPKDAAKAFAYYTEAASQNNTKAYHPLALCCANGEGTNRDPAVADRWFRKALDADASLRNEYLQLVETNALQPAEWNYVYTQYHYKAQENDLHSILKCAELLRTGMTNRGDIQTEADHYIHACGLLYQRFQDPQQVEDLLMNCFDRMNAMGMADTVRRYAQTAEYDWLAIAALNSLQKNGNAETDDLKLLYAVYHYGKCSRFKTLQWLKKHPQEELEQLAFQAVLAAAENGDPASAFESGQRYFFALGTSADPQQGQRWMTKASEAGWPHAEEALQAMRMSEEEKVQAIMDMKKLESAGIPAGLYTAAGMFIQGNGGVYSEEKYISLMEKAANGGIVKAMAEAAGYWQQRPGFYADAAKVYQYGSMAYEHGMPSGYTLIGRVLENSYNPDVKPRAWIYYADAAKKAEPEAAQRCQNLINQQDSVYEKGWGRHMRNDDQGAYRILFPLAMVGNSRAQDVCYTILENGWKDHVTNAETYRIYTAVYQRKPSAKTALELTRICFKELNYEEALKWGEIAANGRERKVYPLLVRIGLNLGDQSIADRYAPSAAEDGDGLSQYIYAMNLFNLAQRYTWEKKLEILEKAGWNASQAAYTHGIEAARELSSAISSQSSELSELVYGAKLAEFYQERDEAERYEQEKIQFWQSLAAETALINEALNSPFDVTDGYGNSGTLDANSNIATINGTNIRVNADDVARAKQRRLAELRKKRMEDAMKDLF